MSMLKYAIAKAIPTSTSWKAQPCTQIETQVEPSDAFDTQTDQEQLEKQLENMLQERPEECTKEELEEEETEETVKQGFEPQFEEAFTEEEQTKTAEASGEEESSCHEEAEKQRQLQEIEKVSASLMGDVTGKAKEKFRSFCLAMEDKSLTLTADIMEHCQIQYNQACKDWDWITCY